MAVIEQRLQALSLHEFHGYVIEAVFFSRVENHHDVGMRQQASGAGFGLETRQEFGARKTCAFFAQPDGFDRNSAPDHRVHSFVNDAHGAAAQFTDDFVSSGFCYSWHRSIDLPPRKRDASTAIPIGANRVAAPVKDENPGKPPDLLSAISSSLFSGNASADTRAPYPDSTDWIFCRSTLLGY